MATVKARKRKKGTVYCAEVRIKGHPCPSKTFDRMSDAMRWAEDTEKALRNGDYVGNTPPNDMLLDDTLAKYLDETSSDKAKSTHHRELYSPVRSIIFSATPESSDDGEYLFDARGQLYGSF